MSKALDGIKGTAFAKPVLGGEIVGHRPAESATLASAEPVTEPARARPASDDDEPDLSSFVRDRSDDDDDDDDTAASRRPGRRSREEDEPSEGVYARCFPFCD